MAPIYLDSNATTPIEPAVFEAMRPYLTAHFGNATARNAMSMPSPSVSQRRGAYSNKNRIKARAGWRVREQGS